MGHGWLDAVWGILITTCLVVSLAVSAIIRELQLQNLCVCVRARVRECVWGGRVGWGGLCLCKLPSFFFSSFFFFAEGGKMSCRITGTRYYKSKVAPANMYFAAVTLFT